MPKNFIVFWVDYKNAPWYTISSRQQIKCAGVAQQVEQLTCNQQVGGSIPSTSSIKEKAQFVKNWAFSFMEYNRERNRTREGARSRKMHRIFTRRARTLGSIRPSGERSEAAR